MVKAILFCVMVSVSVQAQYLITYDSRFETNRFDQYPAIDISDTDSRPFRAYSKRLPLRSVTTPALFSLEYPVSVTITGTLQQARRDLRIMYRERKPERSKLANALGSGRLEERLGAGVTNINESANATQLKNRVAREIELRDKILFMLMEHLGVGEVNDGEE